MPQRVALPPVSMRNARGGDGTGTQGDRPHLLLSWHGNRPLFSIGRESQDGKVASRVHQGGTDPILAQLLQGGIDGHTFGDASEVELDAGRQRHTPADGVDLDTTPAASRLTRDDRVETGRLGGLDSLEVIEGAIIAHPHQLIQQGGIIDAMCSLGCGERSRQDGIEQVTDGCGFSSVLIELRQLTVWYETAQGLFPLSK